MTKLEEIDLEIKNIHKSSDQMVLGGDSCCCSCVASCCCSGDHSEFTQ